MPMPRSPIVTGDLLVASRTIVQSRALPSVVYVSAILSGAPSVASAYVTEFGVALIVRRPVTVVHSPLVSVRYATVNPSTAALAAGVAPARDPRPDGTAVVRVAPNGS